MSSSSEDNGEERDKFPFFGFRFNLPEGVDITPIGSQDSSPVATRDSEMTDLKDATKVRATARSQLTRTK